MAKLVPVQSFGGSSPHQLDLRGKDIPYKFSKKFTAAVINYDQLSQVIGWVNNPPTETLTHVYVAGAHSDGALAHIQNGIICFLPYKE